jgi:hypothetical protein
MRRKAVRNQNDLQLHRLAVNPMLAFGACAEAGRICDECRHFLYWCNLRGKKMHDRNWPACSKFKGWKDWYREQGMKAVITIE